MTNKAKGYEVNRFERNSDGSYAWGSRKTYIKELEILGIDVQNLLIGIALQAENVSPNHYRGSVRRLGRAFAETKERHTFEATLKEMIQNAQLDENNRYRMYYLYLNYIYNLDDEAETKGKIKALKNEINDYPTFLSRHIQKLKELP